MRCSTCSAVLVPQPLRPLAPVRAGDLSIPATATLPPRALEAIAQRVAELIGEPAPASPWLDVAEAAAYLRCSRQRVYDLTSSGRLRVAKDGARNLYRRGWLDEYLLAEQPSELAVDDVDMRKAA